MFQSIFKHQKPAYSTKLNLVALMDIFTILVFFLLLNSGEAEKLENARFVELPNSQAGTTPHSDLVVMIGKEGVWLGEDMVVSMDEVADSADSSIPALSAALAEFRERKGELNTYEKENGLALTIMGDQAVTYGLLEAVMATCRLENFRDIALAVNRVAAPTPAAPPVSEGEALSTTTGSEPTVALAGDKGEG